MRSDQISKTNEKTGLVLLAIGAIMTLFSGISFITKDKIVDAGAVEITRNKQHGFDWSPLIGVAVMAFGTGVYFFGRRNLNTMHLSR